MENLSSAGIDFIKGFEGCSLTPYEDVGGTATIGYGFTHYPNGMVVTMQDTPLTQEEADAMFLEIVQPYCDGVKSVCNVSLNDDQLAALTSFAYNLGVKAFQRSSLAQHVNQNCVVESDFTTYDHVGNNVVQGLLNRRIAEYNLFITSVPNVEKLQSNNNMNPTTEENVNGAVSESANVENTAETQNSVTQETLQVLKIQGIQVSYERIIAGQVTDTRTVAVTTTPELITAFAQSDLVEAGWNIKVE